MSDSFNISPESVPGLGADLVDKKALVERDLALVKDQGRKWKLIDLRKEKAPTDKPSIQGKGLFFLMKAAANTEEVPTTLAQVFSEKELHNLTRDAKFRGLCRMVPGMESAEHAQTRAKSSKVLARSMESAKVIGKGLSTIEKRGIEGRYVGQEQEEQSYWIREVVFRGASKSVNEIDIINDSWRDDTSSSLSLKEWEVAKRQEWEQAKSGQDFLPWIANQAWQARERKVFEKTHPTQPFNEKDFEEWTRAQLDPELFLPTWLLQEIHQRQLPSLDFQTWRKNTIQDRKRHWEDFKKITGAKDLSFEEHEKLDFVASHSGVVERPDRWILKHLWEKAKTGSSPTKDDFQTFVQRLKFTKDHPAQATEEEFRAWKAAQDRALHERHEGSHLPLTFEKWKSQQDDDITMEPTPFIALEEKERQGYHTTCEAGRLIRNKFPYDTKFDKTLHSGEGYAIFVIGPNDDLYCGSHIGNVFHHSSFLGDAAVVAAGEIKTNPDGTIAELSSKSGHYRPKDAQNLYMLRYFQHRGVDISNIKFTSYDSAWKTVERNTLEYLKELEYKESMGGLDKIDPTIFE